MRNRLDSGGFASSTTLIIIVNGARAVDDPDLDRLLTRPLHASIFRDFPAFRVLHGGTQLHGEFCIFQRAYLILLPLFFVPSFLPRSIDLYTSHASKRDLTIIMFRAAFTSRGTIFKNTQEGGTG